MHKVFTFCVPVDDARHGFKEKGNVIGFAVGDDGRLIYMSLCQSDPHGGQSFVKQQLGAVGSRKHDVYHKSYGEDFEVVWLESANLDKDLISAISKGVFTDRNCELFEAGVKEWGKVESSYGVKRDVKVLCGNGATMFSVVTTGSKYK